MESIYCTHLYTLTKLGWFFIIQSRIFVALFEEAGILKDDSSRFLPSSLTNEICYKTTIKMVVQKVDNFRNEDLQ